MALLYLATGNFGKLREIQALLAHLTVEIRSLKDLSPAPIILEDGETFNENAVKKAEAVCRLTGEVTLADDSGLEVDFLQGAPGVRSARFAGEGAGDLANNNLLLEKLQGVPLHLRGARFCCVMAVAAPGRKTAVATGCCRGLITLEPRGDEGFGYDPLFLVPAYQKTFGELSPDIKNRISHRSRALARALVILEKLLK
jgi:XTP/dITP diphosphohydrolase